MTPKEKADDLVKKMYAVHSNSASDITLYFAKQCALVALRDTVWGYLDQWPVEQANYWIEVKQEIEKL
jgi:hypothetical protein